METVPSVSRGAPLKHWHDGVGLPHGTNSLQSSSAINKHNNDRTSKRFLSSGQHRRCNYLHNLSPRRKQCADDVPLQR